MIVCICRNILEKKICNVICNGCVKLEDLQEELDVCINCECCKDALEVIIRDSNKE